MVSPGIDHKEGNPSMLREKAPFSWRYGKYMGMILFVLLLPFIATLLALFFLHRFLLYILIWCLWVPQGIEALVVYSDSPIWQEYMNEQIIPLLERRAV